MPLIKTLLEAPLCYQAGGASHGTLKILEPLVRQPARRLAAAFRQDGHAGRADPNATVDAWISGGLQFTNGAAYSYVVLVGTGSRRSPGRTGCTAAQVAAPLLDVLLAISPRTPKRNPRRDLLPVRRPAPRPPPVANKQGPAVTATVAQGSDRARVPASTKSVSAGEQAMKNLLRQ